MIFVDQAIWPAHGRRFAHLISDESYDELHAFAAGLGLPERAFHRDHYDIPDAWVGDAVAAGATEIDPRELVGRLRASGLRRPKVRERPVRDTSSPRS
jgi:hypothetical protein